MADKNIMTIIYKKSNLDIKEIGQGKQYLYDGMNGLTLDEANLIYDIIYIYYYAYVFKRIQDFELVKNDDGNITIQMKQSAKDSIQKYL